MFSRKREETLLESATDRAIRALKNHPVGDPEYVRTLKLVSELHELKTREAPKPVSRDTLAVVGANILGILLIINHEYAHPITSRAMTLLLKPR